VDQLNKDLIRLSNLLMSLIPFDPRSSKPKSTSLPVKVDQLIKLKDSNQVAVITAIGGGAAAAGQDLRIVNWRILRSRSKSQASGILRTTFEKEWGIRYEIYEPNPRMTYLGPTPSKGDDVGKRVKARMQRQGKYDPVTGNILYKGNPVHESGCDMGHLVDAVTWWNSNGYLTFPQSPEVLRFMNDPDNYELEPSGPNRAKGAALGGSGVTYRPPVG
jgi:hypothetical protein